MTVRTRSSEFSPDETRSWLAWIARHMRREHQTVFLIENLQPSWLATRAQRVLYVLIDSTALGLVTGLIFYIAWTMSLRLDPPAPQPWIPFWMWATTTTVWAILMGVIDDRRLPGITVRDDRTLRQNAGAIVLRAVVMAAVWAALWWLWRLAFGDGYAAFALCGRGNVACPDEAGTQLSLRHPLLCAAYLALVYGSKVRGDETVKPVEALGWSWGSALRGLVLGGLAGSIVWIVYAVVNADYPLKELAQNLWLYPPLGAAGGFGIGGLSARVVRDKAEPNQGIWLSLRNGALAASILAPVLALIAWPALVLALRPIRGDVILRDAPIGVFWLGVITALVGFAWFGGREVLMHASLRIVLALTRQTPRDLGRFLDHCVELDFLRRVGGGYVFIHRYLLEYFGALPATRPPDSP